MTDCHIAGLAGIKGPDRQKLVERDLGPPMAYCGAACMQLSDKQQANRSRLAEKVTNNIPIKGLPGMTHKDLGVFGRSWFEKELYYVLPSNFFLVPFAHALLYGVVKDFWDELLPSTTGQSALSGIPSQTLCMCKHVSPRTERGKDATLMVS